MGFRCWNPLRQFPTISIDPNWIHWMYWPLVLHYLVGYPGTGVWRGSEGVVWIMGCSGVVMEYPGTGQFPDRDQTRSAYFASASIAFCSSPPLPYFVHAHISSNPYYAGMAVRSCHHHIPAGEPMDHHVCGGSWNHGRTSGICLVFELQRVQAAEWAVGCREVLWIKIKWAQSCKVLLLHSHNAVISPGRLYLGVTNGSGVVMTDQRYRPSFSVWLSQLV